MNGTNNEEKSNVLWKHILNAVICWYKRKIFLSALPLAMLGEVPEL